MTYADAQAAYEEYLRTPQAMADMERGARAIAASGQKFCECCGAPVVDGFCSGSCEHPADEDWSETCRPDPHAGCPDGAHNPDGTDAPAEQALTADGALACNHCGPTRAMAYCSRLECYVHVDHPEDGCFLIPPRG